MRTPLLLLLIFFAPIALFPQWAEFHVLPGESLWASSVLSETLGDREYSYPPENLFDSDASTAWVEGVPGTGAGESVVILTGMAVSELSLINGFAKSGTLFEKNNRVKEIRLDLIAGYTAPGMVSETDAQLYLVKEFVLEESLLLKDSMDQQSFQISLSPEEQFELCRTVLKDFAEDNPFFLEMMLRETGVPGPEYLEYMNFLVMMEAYGFMGIRMTILDVYRGSHYNDTCLAELSLNLEEF